MTAALAQLPRRRGWHQPIGWGRRATLVDPALPHQIGIASDGALLTVTCTCLAVPTHLGRFASLGQAWDLYNAHLPLQADAVAERGLS